MTLFMKVGSEKYLAYSMNNVAKPQLIILPGWGGSKESWSDFRDLAAKNFEVHCIELPCFGNEPCPKDVRGVENYATFVQKTMAILLCSDGQKRFLFGLSFGGQPATYVAAKNLIHIDGLILAAASIVRPKKSVKRFILFILSKIAKIPGLQKFFKKHREQIYNRIGSPDYTKTQGVQQDIYKKVIRQDLQNLLNNITIPTLLVWGTKDRYTPLKYARRIAKKIRNCSLQVIPNATHGLHLKTKQEFFQIVNTYAQRIS